MEYACLVILNITIVWTVFVVNVVYHKIIRNRISKLSVQLIYNFYLLFCVIINVYNSIRVWFYIVYFTEGSLYQWPWNILNIYFLLNIYLFQCYDWSIAYSGIISCYITATKLGVVCFRSCAKKEINLLGVILR